MSHPLNIGLYLLSPSEPAGSERAAWAEDGVELDGGVYSVRGAHGQGGRHTDRPVRRRRRTAARHRRCGSHRPSPRRIAAARTGIIGRKPMMRRSGRHTRRPHKSTRLFSALPSAPFLRRDSSDLSWRCFPRGFRVP